MKDDFPDDISDVTLSDSDLKPHYYLYYHNHPVSSITIYVYCHYFFHDYILYRNNETPVKINDLVINTDRSLYEAITRIFFEQTNKYFFNSCKFLSKNIFLNYLQSQQTQFKYKKCTLTVFIRIDELFFQKGVELENTCWIKKVI